MQTTGPSNFNDNDSPSQVTTGKECLHMHIILKGAMAMAMVTAMVFASPSTTTHPRPHLTPSISTHPPRSKLFYRRLLQHVMSHQKCLQHNLQPSTVVWANREVFWPTSILLAEASHVQQGVQDIRLLRRPRWRECVVGGVYLSCVWCNQCAGVWVSGWVHIWVGR